MPVLNPVQGSEGLRETRPSKHICHVFVTLEVLRGNVWQRDVGCVIISHDFCLLRLLPTRNGAAAAERERPGRASLGAAEGPRSGDQGELGRRLYDRISAAWRRTEIATRRCKVTDACDGCQGCERVVFSCHAEISTFTSSGSSLKKKPVWCFQPMFFPPKRGRFVRRCAVTSTC